MRALKPGQFSKSAIITPAGWHLVQVDDIRPFELPPFDQLKEQVRQSEMAARRQQLIDETRAAAKISGLE
jgi:peptidyl-prolyl cis-trans isomerase C